MEGRIHLIAVGDRERAPRQLIREMDVDRQPIDDRARVVC